MRIGGMFTPALLAALAGLCLPGAAGPFRNYAHEHPRYCADAWANKDSARSLCASRARGIL